LYKRLLALSPGDVVLNFDIIGVLAYNLDGTFDERKAKNLVRLFRPDKYDEVSLLHFVASCDNVYKKLRYLRASVGNSTQIDGVLENIANGVFFFFLGLMVLSILNMNPWTLLVSMSTVLVSFAFALGPSAAKLIEGMIMIAIRRPFDLGDRISIVDSTGPPDNSDDPGYHDTWLVEDVNLFTTTLRLSRTNEISSINNGSIANTRIVNHGRSHNALVNITLLVKIETTSDRIELLKQAIEQYIRNKPRVWSSLINFMVKGIDTAAGYVAYTVRIQNVKSWQDLLPVLQAKGDLEKFCNEILTQLDIIWDTNVTTNSVYIKELPDQHNFLTDDVPFPDDALQGDVPETHQHSD
jgi:small-conductance mechanosensitive channel